MTPNPRPSAGSHDDRTINVGDRVAGFLGTWSSTFTLAWLASHRDRLRTLILGGHRLSVLVVWDSAGRKLVSRSDADERAIYQLVYGEPWPEESDQGAEAT